MMPAFHANRGDAGGLLAKIWKKTEGHAAGRTTEDWSLREPLMPQRVGQPITVCGPARGLERSCVSWPERPAAVGARLSTPADGCVGDGGISCGACWSGRSATWPAAWR